MPKHYANPSEETQPRSVGSAITSAKSDIQGQISARCPLCRLIFSDKQVLENHMHYQHGKKRNRRKHPQKYKTPTVKCYFCKKPFSKHGIRRHIRAAHKEELQSMALDEAVAYCDVLHS